MADKRIPVGHGDSGSASISAPINGTALLKLLTALMTTRPWIIHESPSVMVTGGSHIKVEWKRAKNDEIIK